MKSFLMIGQSNMAGRGDFDEVSEIVNAKCFMLRMGLWVDMSEPINPDRAMFGHKFHSGVGLAASFADECAKYLGEDAVPTEDTTEASTEAATEAATEATTEAVTE